MIKDPVKTAENELLWEANITHGLAWINKGLTLIIIMLAETNSLLWYLLFIPVFVLYSVARKHYIYPRTGQVKLKNDFKTSDALIYGFVVFAIPIYFYLLGMWKNYVPGDTTRLGLCVAFLVGSLMWLDYKAWDGKSAFPIWEKIIIIVVLLSLFWLEPNKLTLFLLLGSYGLFNFGYGLVTFIRFIRNNPVLPNE